MSDFVVKSDEDQDARQPEVKSTCRFQSWMSRWTRASSSKPGNEESHRQNSPLYEHSEAHGNRGTKRPAVLPGIEMELSSSKRVKNEPGETSGCKVIDFVNENTGTSSGKLGNNILKASSFPIFKCSQNSESDLALKNGQPSSHQKGKLQSQVGLEPMLDFSPGSPGNQLFSKLGWVSFRAKTVSRGFPILSEGINWNSEHQIKSYALIERNSIPRRRSLLYEPGEVIHTNDAFIFNNHVPNVIARGSTHNPSSSNNHPGNFFGEQFKRLQNTSDSEQVHREIIQEGMSKVENVYPGSLALARMSPSVHDLETMRTYPTIDSIEEFSGVLPKFSQTTHHFFVTKQTDLNLPDGGQIISESTFKTNIKGKGVSEFDPSPDFSFHVGKGIKLQPLDSSTGSEGEENSENAKKNAVDLKNESSTETDTMEMNSFLEKHIFGAASSLSDKQIKVATEPSMPQPASPSAVGESRGRSMNKELPDMNEEVALLPVGIEPADDGEPSTSKTQSLEAENFLKKTEDLTNSKSVACPDIETVDPFSRWVKRLKPSASSTFAYGNKTAVMVEASSCENVNKLFNKILKCSRSSTELKTSKSHATELMAMDQSAKLQKSAESSSPNSVKSQEITESHGWIRRWCHSQAPSSLKKHEYLDISEPQNSKCALLNIEKKQFPSIAALALMSKTMNGFPPCEIKKRGAFVAWNTKK